MSVSAKPESSRQLVSRRPAIVSYGVAVVAAVAATLLRASLTPIIGEAAIPFITYFPAVLLVAWYGGFRPACLCILLSALAGDYYFIVPFHSILLPSIGDQVTTLIFVLVALGIALLGDSQRRAVDRAKTESEYRKEAEAAEREHRQRLQTTLSSIGDAVMATDATGRITFVNGITLGLLRQKEEEILGKGLDDVFRILNEYTRAPVESPVAKVLRDGAIVGLANHTVLVCPDGREIPIDDSAAPIRDADGTLRGTVLVFRDITVRRRAEETSRLLASIVESSEDAIISKDLQGNVTSWNTGAEQIFGYTANEMIGRPISVIAAPDRPDEMPAILERVKNGERIEHYETVRRSKAGALVNISLTVSPVRDATGRIVGASKVARNITESKQAEERLHRSQEETKVARDWLETTLASIGDAVIATDTEGRVTFLNSVAASLTGWSQDNAKGKNLGDVFVITNEETGASVESPVTKALREGRIVGLANHTKLTAKDGRHTPIDDSAAPIRDRDGRIIGVVLVFRDVAERKKAESALNEAFKLAQSAAQEVQGANRALLRANEDLKQFAFAASHDLQEPLRMITSYSQLLINSYRGQLDGEAGVCVSFISRGTRRMRELLSDLLAYTHLTGEDQVELELVDLNSVFQKALDNLKASIEESNAEIRSAQLPIVYGHGAHFLQLFQNLLGNAIKYRGDNALEVNVSSAKDGGNWRVSVSDNGIGIAPEYHDRIFGVFKRLHGKRIPGTGIGLAICQRVVERYGGRIWVESAANEGATFYFTVPVTEEESAHAS
jgi:PAS domain S-box-containing protein